MYDFFSSKANDEVLMDVFKKYYGSKSNDPNRNQGLPFIKDCSDSKIIKNLCVITNNAMIDFDNENRNSTFDSKNKGFQGTLYSWSVDINCLNNNNKY